METAILAGGCFWGMQDLFKNLPGVISTKVGYTGGHTPDPTYLKIKAGDTGHAEAIEIKFDEKTITYKEILAFFFSMHDATTENRQGNDIGDSYRSAIFYHNEDQRKTAKEVMRALDKKGILPGPLKTVLTKADVFYDAEEMHQDYLTKNPGGYTCHWIRDEWKL